MIAFLDESYNEQRYWVAAVLCRKADVEQISVSLDGVCARAHESFGVNKNAELHGHSLFHQLDEWTGLQPRQRIAVYADALKALVASDIEIFVRGVHVPRLRRRYAYPDHPHSVAFSHLVERLDERAESTYGGARISLLADEVYGADQYQRELWHFQEHATKGYRERQIVCVDDIEFARSHEHRLLQAVDLVAFLNQRIHERQGQVEKQDRVNAALWATVQPRVIHRDFWYP